MTPPLFDINKVRIDDILITNVLIENPDNLSELVREHHEFDLSYGFDPALNVGQKKVRLIFNSDIEVFGSSRNRIGVSAKFTIVFIFSVDNLDELVFRQGDLADADPDLMTALASITYSTSRGIIYTKSQGTIIEKFIFPTVSNTKLREIFSETPDETTSTE